MLKHGGTPASAHSSIHAAVVLRGEAAPAELDRPVDAGVPGVVRAARCQATPGVDEVGRADGAVVARRVLRGWRPATRAPRPGTRRRQIAASLPNRASTRPVHVRKKGEEEGGLLAEVGGHGVAVCVGDRRPSCRATVLGREVGAW